MTAPGPAVLGRSVVVGLTDDVPAPWGDADIIIAGEQPDTVAALHQAWATRTPVVIRVDPDDATRWRTPGVETLSPWELSPSYEFTADRLHHLVWANSYDARGGIEPIWWWTRKAERLGAAISKIADVIVDGADVWIDGGPRGPLAVRHIHRETIDRGALDIAADGDVAPSPSIALADDQFAAVAHGGGPARIIAPAGSGKTRVLTERLRHLLGDRRIERELVCAVAYNRRAQEELALRCSAFNPRVVTLNALGWELLGRPPVIEERDVRRIIEGLVPKPARRSNVDPFAPYLEALGRIRLGLCDPAVVEDERDDVPGVADAFEPYRAELLRRGVVDFDEQIYAAVERLLQDGAFRRAQQARFRHLLIDEFQDLTPAHVLLIRLLAAPEFDVFGVGDDDQVIYGHAGADPAFLLDFDQLFPGAASHPLEVNYRCRPAIVTAAKTLLQHNRRRVDKTIRAGRSESDEHAPALEVVTHTANDGASAVVDAVRTALTGGCSLRDIAVLARVNSQLLAPQVALAEAGHLVDGALDERVLDRTGARAALAYLRIATSPSGANPADIREILRRPSRGLPQWFEKWLRGKSMTVADVRSIGDRLDDEKVSLKVASLADDLDLVVRIGRTGTTREILRAVRVRVGLGEAMTTLDASAAASHLDDLEALEQVADLHPEAATFERWLRGLLSNSKATAAASGDDRITLATVHRVKGREWPMVVLFGVNDGLLPHRLSEDREEERRVFHVGITRGMDRVVVVADAERPSPFITELDPATPINLAPVRSTARTSPVSPSSAKARGRAAVTVADGPLLERLRSWRAARAKSDGVPAYVVMHDKHLQVIAGAAPQSLVALSRLEGMGPRRMELYGDDIIAITVSPRS
jgi:DNA helicase II / ATP-dependent DNA helicase PcrA